MLYDIVRDQQKIVKGSTFHNPFVFGCVSIPEVQKLRTKHKHKLCEFSMNIFIAFTGVSDVSRTDTRSQIVL